MRTSYLPIALTMVVDDPTNVLFGSLHEKTERQIVRRISWDGCLCDDMIYGMSNARSASSLAWTCLKTVTTRTDVSRTIDLIANEQQNESENEYDVQIHVFVKYYLADTGLVVVITPRR